MTVARAVQQDKEVVQRRVGFALRRDSTNGNKHHDCTSNDIDIIGTRDDPERPESCRSDLDG